MSKKDCSNLPLKILNDYSVKYPRLWAFCDEYYKKYANFDKEKCASSDAMGSAAYFEFHMPENAIDIVPALYTFKKYKEIYVFDEETADTICVEDEDFDIPAEILMKMPFPGFFIDSPKFKFFTHLDHTPEADAYQIKFFRILDDGKYKFYNLLIGNFTIARSIRISRFMLKSEFDKIENQKNLKIYEKLVEINQKQVASGEYDRAHNQADLCYMLQLVLYICADNAEIKEIKSTSGSGKKKSQSRSGEKSVRKWEAGAYIGAAVRRMKEEPEPIQESEPKENAEQGRTPYEEESKQPASGKEGVPKRPHIRRAHWAHFWAGKLDGSEVRRLILKWLAPLYINAKGEKEIPARMNKIDSGKDKK